MKDIVLGGLRRSDPNVKLKKNLSPVCWRAGGKWDLFRLDSGVDPCQWWVRHPFGHSFGSGDPEGRTGFRTCRILCLDNLE